MKRNSPFAFVAAVAANCATGTAAVKENVRRELTTVRGVRADLPPPASRLGSAAWGFLLPFWLLREVRRDRALRTHFWRLVSVQLAIIAPITILTSSGLLWGLGALIRWGAKITIKGGGTSPVWLAATALYGNWLVVEWCVVTLARDHSDQFTHRLALMSGVPAEPAPLDPRVRIDLRHLWHRVQRLFFGALLALVSVPALWLLNQAPVLGSQLSHAAGTAWALYWTAVFTAGKSQLAWRTLDGSPWYLRALDWLARLPVVRPLVRAYRRAAHRVTRKVAAPAVALERVPWQLSGLTLVRILGGLPVLSIVIRPLLPVAAAHALVRGGGVRAIASSAPVGS